MIGFFNRLDQYFLSKGLKYGAVETACGLSNGVIGKAMKRGSMTTDILFKVIEHYDVNIGWLFTGKGDMDRTLAVDPSNLSEEEELDIINVIDLNINRFAENEKFRRIVKEVKSSEFEEDIKKQIADIQQQIKSIGKKTF